MRLHIRLALGTGLLLLGMSLALGVWIAKVAERYQAEIAQRLNAGIAMYVTRELALIDANGVNQDALKELAHRVMTVNPSAEVYLLDGEGRIVASLLAPSRLRQTHVSLEPIGRFLRSSPGRLIYGDDPTSPDAQAAFSVAPVRSAAAHLGYLYVVLGGRRFDSVVAAVRGSYSLKIGLIATAGILLTAFAIGIGLFAALTLPLRKLTQRMADWSEQTAGRLSERAVVARSADEIAALERQFDSMAERISEQLAEIRSRDVQRRDLMAAIAHDLRTPLASLHGYIETVLLKGQTLPEAARRQYLEIARHHSERLERLIASLFELSKLEAGIVVPKMEPFAIAELLQDIALRFRLRAQQLGIEIATQADPAAPFVVGDIALIERIFENLLDNALRHTPAGGQVKLHARCEPHCMIVGVSDTGAGVAVENLQQVFEPYYRGSEQRRGTGAGLGLAIVRQIVGLHGQRVWMRSGTTVGTTVEFGLAYAHQDPTGHNCPGASSKGQLAAIAAVTPRN